MYKVGDDITIEHIINSEDTHIYKTRIADISSDCFYIDVPINKETGQYHRFSKGENLLFVFQDKHHVPHQFKSSVLGSKIENELTFYMIQHPLKTEIKKIQRRNYLRMPLVTDARFEGEGIDSISAKTINISGGGLAFLSNVSLEVGQILKWYLVLSVEGGPLQINGEGEVIRVDVDEDGKNLVSIDFIELSPDFEQHIIRYCLNEQVKLRRVKN
ncbi:flagellar brake protein [Niallia taxi]|uniref:flagellar brake protein n=1 Tax=Niallia taxi TaxID=2499688 RepID=UPI0015F661F0|nr:PilZ domain-containing protein [Niallia taxi]